MKQRCLLETLLAHLVLFSLLLNILSPCGLALAAPINEPTALKISHFPIKVAKFGSKISFRVHVADDADIKQVTLVILDGDKPLRGKMTELVDEGQVPVQARTRAATGLYISTKPGVKPKSSLPAGEILDVSQEINSFYRVVSSSGKKGYVRTKDVDVLSYGAAYTATLPSSMTQRSTLTYRIEANDLNSARSATENTKIRLLTTDEIQKLVEQYRKAGKLSQQTAKADAVKRGDAKLPKPTTKTAVRATKPSFGLSTPVIKKPAFWGGVAIAGGLAYYFLKDKKEDENLATLNVMVEWE
jgi:hypothetical protein